jgi:hypothetical protein
LSPLAISRSTKQKHFQSLKQASLIGLSAMPTGGVFFVDAAVLSEIATILLLTLRSSITNNWHTKTPLDVIRDTNLTARRTDVPPSA